LSAGSNVELAHEHERFERHTASRRIADRSFRRGKDGGENVAEVGRLQLG
jgi:hypothetical protein